MSEFCGRGSIHDKFEQCSPFHHVAHNEGSFRPGFPGDTANLVLPHHAPAGRRKGPGPIFVWTDGATPAYIRCLCEQGPFETNRTGITTSKCWWNLAHPVGRKINWRATEEDERSEIECARKEGMLLTVVVGWKWTCDLYHITSFSSNKNVLLVGQNSQLFYGIVLVTLNKMRITVCLLLLECCVVNDLS